MNWHNLLFAHWPIAAEVMQRALPGGLAPDTYNGAAWLGVVPFRMTGVRPRGMPRLPGLHAFPELNVRTYVTLGGKPGVYFFSLDATSRVAIEVARRWYQLPYFHARMRCRDQGSHVEYSSRRAQRGAPAAEFEGTYRPTGQVFRARPGTLEHFLTERYCLYTVNRRGQVCRADIHHAPWPLQPAEARIEKNTMAAAHGFALPDSAPVLYFVRRLDVVAWPLRPVVQ